MSKHNPTDPSALRIKLAEHDVREAAELRARATTEADEQAAREALDEAARALVAARNRAK